MQTLHKNIQKWSASGEFFKKYYSTFFKSIEKYIKIYNGKSSTHKMNTAF